MDKDSNQEKASNIRWYTVPLALVAGIGIGIGAAIVILTTFPQRKGTLWQYEQEEITSTQYRNLSSDAKQYPEAVSKLQEFISKNGKITNTDMDKIHALIEDVKRKHEKQDIAQMKVEPTARTQTSK